MTVLIIVIAIIAFLVLAFAAAVIVLPPRETENPTLDDAPIQTAEHSWRLGRNWFRKSQSGLWELYVEGEPFERGLATGKLTKELIRHQEAVFVGEVQKIVTSRIYLTFLKLLVAAMNRRLGKFIGKEYCSEIHGVSLAAPAEYAWIGPRYQRMLNYHAAHDIGHTLQSYHLVGCTAFSVWGSRSADGSLLTGRNFDFYVGDEFSKEKIVNFCSPAKGFRFASVTWGGMIGCPSGMNEHGLAVVVNGAKSEFPNRSATPVSILVREVLQYCRNIQDAFQHIEKRRIFVSESLIVSSAEDKRTVIIEKSRSQTVLFEVAAEQLISTNHFQSKELYHDKSNQKYIAESPSAYRYERVRELLDGYDKISEREIAAVLRDKLGHGNEDIGQGNEKAVDQLLAHHSIIFKPEARIFWVSCGPYTEGAYMAYDLNSIFSQAPIIDETQECCIAELTIPADPFLNSAAHEQFKTYKKYLAAFGSRRLVQGLNHSDDEAFIASNPKMFSVYSALGDHYYKKKEYGIAAKYWETGMSLHCPNLHEFEHMQHGFEKATRKMAKK